MEEEPEEESGDGGEPDLPASERPDLRSKKPKPNPRFLASTAAEAAAEIKSRSSMGRVEPRRTSMWMVDDVRGRDGEGGGGDEDGSG